HLISTANNPLGVGAIRSNPSSAFTFLLPLLTLGPSTRRSPMKTAIVIPARYAAKRLPGKPLLRETGKYLIQHVYERACQARLASTVVVATDDSRIMTAVQ